MATNKNKLRGSIFATKNTDAEQVDRLIRTCLPEMGAAGTVPAKLVAELEPTTGIKYSRAWLILRRAWLEDNAPELIQALPVNDGQDADAWLRACGKLIRASRPTTPEEVKNGVSWGELMVRFGQSEGFVRKAFNSAGVERDLGTRIGRGGRFAYDDAVLYQENRRIEGAQIPVDYKGRPNPEDLLNFKAREQAKRTRARQAPQSEEAKARAKALNLARKLYAKGTDSAVTEEEGAAFMAKVDVMQEQWGFTEAELRKQAS